MVAYSYRKRFVDPIKVGLGLMGSIPFGGGPEIEPKMQTIRADRKRHARPGEEIQHYCGMRTRGCFLIGRSICLSVVPLQMQVREHTMFTMVDGCPIGGGHIHAFARADGFRSGEDMLRFWQAEHGIGDFSGVLIKWLRTPAKTEDISTKP